MKKFNIYIVFILIFFFSFNAYSQTKKKYYYDENNVEISSKQFDQKVDSRKFISNVIDVDTAFMAFLFPYKIMDKLSKVSHHNLNEYLYKLYEGHIDTTKTMIVYFLPYEANKKWKADKIANYKIYADEFLDDMKKDSENVLLWIYQPEIENMTYHNIDKIPWKADSSQLIQKMFFPLINISSIVAIKPSGNYFLINGFDGLDKDYFSFIKVLRF